MDFSSMLNSAPNGEEAAPSWSTGTSTTLNNAPDAAHRYSSPSANADASNLHSTPTSQDSLSARIPQSDIKLESESGDTMDVDVPTPALELSLPALAVKAEEDSEDAEVDITGDSATEVSLARKLQTLPQPKGHSKSSKVKAGKARQALYSVSSPSNSPGPSFLAQELNANSSGAISTDNSREPSPDGPAHNPLNGGGSLVPEVSSSRNSPAPFAFPHRAVDATRTIVPDWTKLSAPFASYAPPRGDDSEEDEAGKVQRRKGKGRAKEVEKEEHDQEEEDDRLYCICQKLYDPDRSMIACDKCENWYHLDCVKIPEDSVELVDHFMCPICQTGSSERTTWKAACARPTCPHAVAPLSKYCSDYCGIEVAATRLDLSGIPPEQFWKRVVGARRREAVALDALLQSNTFAAPQAIRFEEAEDERALHALQEKLSDLVARRQVLDVYLALGTARVRYLAFAIKRWELLCKATAEALANENLDNGKAKAKSKPKGKGGSATSHPDAACGFDVRLVYDNVSWEAWVGGEEGREFLSRDEEDSIDETLLMESGIEQVCLLPRKKCERHTGWQKVRQADFEGECAVLRRRLDRLAQQERRIRGQLDDHEEASRFRALHRNRTANALSVDDDDMAESPHPSPKKKTKSRAVGGKAVAAATPKVEAGDGEQPYEVPTELFGFLSRREQLKLKSRRA